jgi:5-formyltetrahydrofolate cyclo-ligase
MLNRRLRLSEQMYVPAGDRIQKAFLGLPEYERAASVALYAACRGEVPTAMIMEAALAAGKSVWFPRVVRDGMEFRQVLKVSDLSPGRFGLYEPLDTCPVEDPGAIDLFVVPGVAFDRNGHRVGYGMGYYDRVLHPFEGQGRFIGFCYAFQLVDTIADEGHDVVMDRVITEHGTLTFALRQ